MGRTYAEDKLEWYVGGGCSGVGFLNYSPYPLHCKRICCHVGDVARYLLQIRNTYLLTPVALEYELTPTDLDR